MWVGLRDAIDRFIRSVQKTQSTFRFEQRNRHRNAATVTTRTRNERLIARVPMLSQPVLALTKEAFWNRRAIIKRHAHDFDAIGQPGVERLCALQLRMKAVFPEIFLAPDSQESTNGKVVADVIHLEAVGPMCA